MVVPPRSRADAGSLDGSPTPATAPASPPPATTSDQLVRADVRAATFAQRAQAHETDVRADDLTDEHRDQRERWHLRSRDPGGPTPPPRPGREDHDTQSSASPSPEHPD